MTHCWLAILARRRPSGCHNHGNSPPWNPAWHILPQSFYGQYGHVIILWTIYGHLSFGAFMALHLNPEAIAAIYAQM
ncbi:hypothetical protein O181_071872, partial [Austropuccinia psidii MF-1]|nr:hypothetical protein [Austropuccinia psidii MF-1]